METNMTKSQFRKALKALEKELSREEITTDEYYRQAEALRKEFYDSEKERQKTQTPPGSVEEED